MKTELHNCPRCDGAFPPNAPAGLCPRCLAAGIESEAALDHAANTTIRISAADAIEPPIVPANPGPTIGQDFGGYRILSLLGKGGMGAVYEAEQRETGRRVAVKVMDRVLASEADRKRFLREGRLAASVSHPNVVYVFGSEEIDGSPVIVMELVGAGTLHQRIKREGPLPVTEAVEVILQIIDGLEAASAAGVLHRDLKPANCFVGSDGAVKVGDFGLSISTIACGQSLLTAKGSVLGTPAFASPEQLQGEELDVRTDIYSVGATLYHLLTGQAPFHADDMVKLISVVLSKEPISPKDLNPKIPNALAKIVLRCLVKNPTKRYPSYRKLRDGLQPFATVRTPFQATILRRFLAGLIDMSMTLALTFGLTDWVTKLFSLHPKGPARVIGIFLVVSAFFYTIPEWLWGGTLSKLLLGQRVQTRSGAPLSLGRAAWRTGCFLVLFSLVIALWVGVGTMGAAGNLYGPGGAVSWLAWFAILFPFALFVCTAFNGDGALLHDWLSGTRVVSTKFTQQLKARTGFRSNPAGPDVLVPAGATDFGPYKACELLWRRDQAELWLGWDKALLRRVWIHCTPPGTPTLASERQSLGRPGRVRWLLGRRTQTESWDVYEAFQGDSLLARSRQPQPWASVRTWLHDLAEECLAAQKNACPPPVLALDHVWITTGGRALWLDFPCPGLPDGDSIPTPGDSETLPIFARLQRLLDVAGRGAISGERVWGAPGQASSPLVLPLDARAVLQRMRSNSFANLDRLVDALRSMLHRPAEVTRLSRARSLLVPSAIVLLLPSIIGGSLAVNTLIGQRYASLAAVHPDAPALGELLTARKHASPQRDPIEQLDIRIAGQFGHLITNNSFWDDSRVQGRFDAVRREIAENAVRAHPNLSSDHIRQSIALTQWAVDGPIAALLKRFTERRYASLAPIHPEAPDLGDLLTVRKHAKPARDPVEQLDLRIAGEYRHLITNETFWSNAEVKRRLRRDRREFAERALAAYPDPSPEQVREAVAKTQAWVDREAQSSKPIGLLALAVLGLVLLVIVDGASILLRGSPVLLARSGVAIVDKSGREPGRLRLLFRSACVWLPVWAAFLLMADLAPVQAGAVGLTLLLVTFGWALWRPRRGLEDYLAGTYLVPR